MLIKGAHKKAKALGHKSIILLGHKNYYPRFGYERADKFEIILILNLECVLLIGQRPHDTRHSAEPSDCFAHL